MNFTAEMITYSDFIERVSNIKSDHHYLKKVTPVYDDYLRGLYQALGKLCQSIGLNKTIKFLNQKLQFCTSEFNEAQYIQSACELTVMNHFSGDVSFSFEYEKKVCPPKDVDFAITQNAVIYNIEIKCASYQNKAIRDTNQIQFEFQNRMPNIKDKLALWNAIEELLASHGIDNIIENKNMDNNLKDFLENMQSKVLCAPENEVNVLVVCCDDETDIHTWRGYLCGHKGFFTGESNVLSPDKFNRVDYILLTNLFNRHNKFHADNTLSNHWCLSNSFCLLYPNHYSSRNKYLENCSSDIEKISTIFPNLTKEFEEYLKDNDDLPGDVPPIFKQQLRGVAWFTDKKPERRYFAKRPVSNSR